MPGGGGQRKPPREHEVQDKLEKTKQKLLKRDGWAGNWEVARVTTFPKLFKNL